MMSREHDHWHNAAGTCTWHQQNATRLWQGKYFKKQMNTKQFGVSEMSDIVKLVKVGSCGSELRCSKTASPSA